MCKRKTKTVLERKNVLEFELYKLEFWLVFVCILCVRGRGKERKREVEKATSERERERG